MAVTRLLDGALPTARSELAVDIAEALPRRRAGHHPSRLQTPNVFVTPAACQGSRLRLAMGTAMEPGDDAAPRRHGLSRVRRPVTAPGVKIGTAGTCRRNRHEASGWTGDRICFRWRRLYEMRPARAAFPGQNVAIVSDHILNREPVARVSSTPPVPAVPQLILRALQKRREDRYQSAAEMLHALRACGDAVESGEAPPLPAAPVARDQKLVVAFQPIAAGRCFRSARRRHSYAEAFSGPRPR